MRTSLRGMKFAVPALVLAMMISGCVFLPWFTTEIAIAQTSDLSYPIVDTNQGLAYDNVNALTIEPSVGSSFFGQDAQIDGNQMNYVDNGDGTVTDLVTGLMWQQGYSGKMSQDEAAAEADSFNLASYTDWRLPTIKELYSLIDFSGEDVDPMSSSANNPFIDTDYFDFVYGNTSAGERIIDSQWATITLYIGSSNFGQLMFGVNFADGRIKGYGLSDPRGDSMQFYVRYVRGNIAYGENDFYSNGDGTITDLATGLMWSQDDSDYGMDWEDALAYIQDINDQHYLGYSDWHLPNAKELQSIVDYFRSPDTTNSAAIDPIFNATAIINEDGERDWAFYWTSTTHASNRGGQAAAYICFGRGLGYMNNQYVDVHGAGCQRSDPKTGPAIPTGRGPQGDVVRVSNMVRVVRITDGLSTASIGDPPDSQYSPPPGGSQEAFAREQDEGFILFAPLGGTTTYLIDLDGNVVNDWQISGRPGNSVYLLENGNLLATYTVDGTFQGGGIGGGVEELTWDGDEVWSFELATEHAHLHHDVEMLPNGNVLMISWEAKTRQEALAAGLSANQLPESGEVWSEMILEYNPELDQVTWEWHLWDHALPSGSNAGDYPEKIDLAYASNKSSEDWWHFNSVDYSEALDQIVISIRNVSEIWIIDHALTTTEAEGAAGDLLYRYGNPAAHGSSGSQVLYNQHDSEWLDNGNSFGVADSSSGTAAGIRILVFDNGNPRTRPYSRVVELELPNYMNGATSQARVLPAQIVWQYPSEQDVARDVLFADHISGAQRLESGNTLICSGTEGRFFEVTSSGDIVWEYVNPFESTTPNGKTSNEVFRCERYEFAYLSTAQVGASSSLPQGTQNVAVGEQSESGSGAPSASGLATQPNLQGTGATPAPGITQVDPSFLSAGTSNQLLTITLNYQYAPPEHIQFIRIAIADVEAASWTRNGDTIQAWFDIPAQFSPGTYNILVVFPGREGEPITFSYPITIQASEQH